MSEGMRRMRRRGIPSRGDDGEAPRNELSAAELRAMLEEAEERADAAEDQLTSMWESERFMLQMGCYSDKVVDYLADTSEYYAIKSRGEHLISPQQQDYINRMITMSTMAAARAGQDGVPNAAAAGQEVTRLIARGAETEGMTQREVVIYNLQKLFTRVFYGGLSVQVAGIRGGMMAVRATISALSEAIVNAIPESQRENGRLLISTALYLVFSYYVVPYLFKKALNAIMFGAVDCTKSACAKVAESCSIMGGKRKRRKTRGRKRSYKKRHGKSRKVSRRNKTKAGKKRKSKHGKRTRRR